MGLAISLVAKEKEKVIIEQRLFIEVLSTADNLTLTSCIGKLLVGSHLSEKEFKYISEFFFML